MHRRLITFPGWAILSVAISGLFVVAVLLLHRDSLNASSQVNASTVKPELSAASPSAELGSRLQLNYGQWIALLGREAKVAAEQHPKRLTVLAGDSLSLWFPPELLPTDVTWLNQGISGETSAGLLQRLKLFDQTQPETVLVMIGINDLIHGVREETLLANQREIIRHLKAAHPDARIIIQSILPHTDTQFAQEVGNSTIGNFGSGFTEQNPLAMPWAARLAMISNRYIRQLNQQLATIAHEEHAEYVDIHPYFTDAQGDLQASLSTDGLHLSREGYRLWRSHLPDLSQPLPQAASRKQKAKP